MTNNREKNSFEPISSPSEKLGQDRNFNLFWAGQTFDALGDSFALIVMPLLVLEATGSVAQMGLITGTIGVGNLVSGVSAGAIVDRVDRRWLMIGSDIGRACFYALIPLGWWLGGASMALLYVVAAITAYLTTTFLITYTAAVPNVVGVDRATEANGRLQATVALAYVVGPMLAGLTSSRFHPAWAMGIVSLAYLVSALLMFLVRFRQSTVAEPEKSDRQSRPLAEFLAGIRFLLNHPVLKSVTLVLATFIFFSEATIDLSIFRLKHELHQNNDGIGLVFATASLGALLGGLIAHSLRRQKGFGFSFLGSLMLQGLAITLIGIAPTAAIMAIFATFFSFGLTIRNVSSMTLRQQVTPDRILGRVSAALWTLINLVGPMGTALATGLAEKIGVPIVLVIMGAIGVLVALVGFSTAANSRHPEKLASLS